MAYKNFFYHYVLLIVLILFVACSPEKASPLSLTNPTKGPEQSLARALPLAFMVYEPSGADETLSDITKTIKLWTQSANVHIFADPRHESWLKKFEKSGAQSHEVQQENLGTEWGKIVRQNASKNLVIFFSMHGADNGNFCYQSKSSCAFSEDILLNNIKELALSQKSLESVLIIPLSCNNKKIADKFTNIAKMQPWPFKLTILSQSIEDLCGTSTVGNMLYIKHFHYLRRFNMSFIDVFFQQKNLRELLEKVNFYTPPSSQYIIHDINNAQQPIGLNDFGFNDLLLTYSGDCFGHDFSGGTVESWYNKYFRDIKNKKIKIVSIIFFLGRKGGEYSKNYSYPVNGNMRTTFDKTKFTDLISCVFDVRFSKAEGK